VVKVDRRIRWHYTTTILRLRIGARLTRCRTCKFHNFARTISRHADGISRYSVPPTAPSAGPLLPLVMSHMFRSKPLLMPERLMRVYRLPVGDRGAELVTQSRSVSYMSLASASPASRSDEGLPLAVSQPTLRLGYNIRSSSHSTPTSASLIAALVTD